MDQFNKELASVLLSHGDLREVFRTQLENTLNVLLQTELTTILGYNPYEREGFNTGNSRNGQYFRQLASEYGKLNICVPRDRNGQFKTALIPPYTRRADVLEQTVIQLYEKGITTREIADGLVGLKSALEQTYPQAKFQRCLVHVSRNIMQKVRVSDRAEVMSEFKQIHEARDLPEAQEILSNFNEHWRHKYLGLTKGLAEMDGLLTFLEFPSNIRGTIYSTNIIESFNKSLKRRTKAKEQFPNEAALDRFLVTQVLQYNDKNFGRAHKGFKQCQDTLESMF